MSKIVYLVILLSCITILINGVPIPSEDTDDSSSSSEESSEESSDETKSKEKISNPSQSTNSNQNNPGQQPQVPQNLLGRTQSLSNNLQSTAVPSSTIPPDGNLDQNNPNIEKRDTTIVHTNAHQGGPEQTSRIASSSTERSHHQYGSVQTSNENRQLGQNRQARDTDNDKTPSLLASSSTERSESQNKNDGQTSNDDNDQYSQNNQNRQVRDTNNDDKPPSLLTSSSTERSNDEYGYVQTSKKNLQLDQNGQVRDTNSDNPPSLLASSSTERSDNQNKNVQSSNADNNQYHQKDQNRQSRETNKNNNNPPSLLASSSTERSENQYRNLQTSNENSKQNRQRRDTDQETQAKVVEDNVHPVPSSPSEPQFSTYGVKPQSSSSVPTPNRQSRNSDDEKTPDDQLTPRRILSSDSSSSRTTDNLPNTNGNIQTRDPNDNQDRKSRDVVIEKTSSTQTFTSPTSSSEKSSSSDTTSTTRHSIFNTDTTTEETTESSTDNNENTDRTIPTSALRSTQEPGDIYGENLRKTTGPSRSIRESVPRVVTVSPYDTSFVDEGNSQNNGAYTSDTNRDEQKNLPSLTDTNTPENSEYSSESKKFQRDTAEDKSVKILTPSRSLDGSTLKPDDIPSVNVQNFEPNQRKVRESSTEKSETSNAPDEVKIEKLYETPLFPRRLQ